MNILIKLWRKLTSTDDVAAAKIENLMRDSALLEQQIKELYIERAMEALTDDDVMVSWYFDGFQQSAHYSCVNILKNVVAARVMGGDIEVVAVGNGYTLTLSDKGEWL